MGLGFLVPGSHPGAAVYRDPQLALDVDGHAVGEAGDAVRGQVEEHPPVGCKG